MTERKAKTTTPYMHHVDALTCSRSAQVAREMFVLREGTVDVLDPLVPAGATVLARGAYFGEGLIMGDKYRQESVVVRSPTPRCLGVGKLRSGRFHLTPARGIHTNDETVANRTLLGFRVGGSLTRPFHDARWFPSPGL